MKDPETAHQLQIALDSCSVTMSELNNTIDLFPSSRCEAVLEQQVQQFLQERELLKAQVAEVMECLKKAQLERDAYAQQLKTEGAVAAENPQNGRRTEPSILKHPAGPSDLEKNLKTETKYLRDKPREQERLQQAKMRLWEAEECTAFGAGRKGAAGEAWRTGDCNLHPIQEGWEVPFLNAAKASAQEEQARLCEQLQKQQVCCQHQAHPVASALKEPEAAAVATGTGSESGCGETQRALQGALNKLQRDFMDIAKENSDLKERVEKLELGFIQVSGERDMIRRSIKPNDCQRAVAKTQHQKKNDISMLSQAKEEMKAKLLELQGPVMQLVIDHEVQHPANEPTPGATAPQELGAADKDGILSSI
uniref:golgin subfamily A member 2 isoform X3 n=1 Tax=Callithrix jacchus TaxID=9483 RepID=UPI0023DD3FA1|nr:golgin subfamily A member 2 isoform X3 [Callithrix jacchus]